MRFLPRHCLVAILLLVLAPTDSRATRIVVPDDVPTIQQALDSGLDTVQVRGGTYPEIPVVRHPVVLLATDGPSNVSGLRIQDSAVVDGFHFSGRVQLDNGAGNVSWVHCRLDSGLIHVNPDSRSVEALTVQDCVIHGELSAEVRRFDFQRNDVTGTVGAGGGSAGSAVVRDNLVRQPGVPPCAACGQGLTLGDFGTCEVSNNQVIGFRWGIWITSETTVMSNNRVEDCVEVGIALDGHDLKVTGNQVLRCGIGISMSGLDRAEVSDNRVLGSTFEGLSVSAGGVARVEGNVIGRSGRTGLSVSCGTNGALRIARNTSYLNGGSGLMVEAEFDVMADSAITHNVGFGNSRYGLEGTLVNAAPPACNDWYANLLGASGGISAGAEDLAVDPEFCAVDLDDVRLESDSPLLGAPCGQIGARGAGCHPAASATTNSRAADFGLGSMVPNPTAGPARLTFHLSRSAVVELAVLDVQGREIERLASGTHGEGNHTALWNGTIRGATAPSGIYFIRLRHPGGRHIRRLLLTR